MARKVEKQNFKANSKQKQAYFIEKRSFLTEKPEKTGQNGQKIEKIKKMSNLSKSGIWLRSKIF